MQVLKGMDPEKIFWSKLDMTTGLIIKLGQLRKGKPLLDKDVYGLRINIARRVIRAVKKADQKLYYDEWWNGRESGNPNFELAPSESLRKDFIKSKTITWPEYVERFTNEIRNNPKAQNALKELSNYEGIVTLLCHCSDENFCHRSIVKNMIVAEE
jgi:uncharacterized protein YeaO (DUF488 family)